eukprot:2067523-Pyramimonas_sp.AAC.1
MLVTKGAALATGADAGDAKGKHSVHEVDLSMPSWKRGCGTHHNGDEGNEANNGPEHEVLKLEGRQGQYQADKWQQHEAQPQDDHHFEGGLLQFICSRRSMPSSPACPRHACST